MNIDDLYWKTHIAGKFTCWDFACLVLKRLTGKDLSGILTGGDERTQIRSLIKNRDKFIKIESPKELCLVVIKNISRSPHVGVFYSGKILHLDKQGVKLEDPRRMSPTNQEMEYYQCCD